MLRSIKELENYAIGATDGTIGHVKDFYFDDGRWVIRYLVVDTSNWWLGHQVLIAPQWIEGISWVDATVSINMTRQAVKDSPPWNPAAPPNGAQETTIYEHYGRPA